jgi:hypothetical protein
MKLRSYTALISSVLGMLITLSTCSNFIHESEKHCSCADDNPALAKVSSTTTVIKPIVNGYGTGNNKQWTSSCGNQKWDKYYQITYDKVSPTQTCDAIPFYLFGANLDLVFKITIDAKQYQVVSWSILPTKITLDIRALTYNNWPTVEYLPAPTAKPTLTLYFNDKASGSCKYITETISPGIIPVFFYDNQAYGQCTSYAGIIRRNQVGLPIITAYNMPENNFYPFKPLSGNPSDPGFPKQYAVLCTNYPHMAFIENVSAQDNSKVNGTIIYTITGTQYNVPCGESKSSWKTVMTVDVKNNYHFTLTGDNVSSPLIGIAL